LLKVVVPALLNRASMRPNFSAAAAIARQSASWATSPWARTVSAPWAWHRRGGGFDGHRAAEAGGGSGHHHHEILILAGHPIPPVCC